MPIPKAEWTAYATEMQTFSIDSLVNVNQIDLSADAFINGNYSVFTWIDTDTYEPVTAGITNYNGLFTFDPSLFDGKTLFCKVENDTFPPRAGWEVYYSRSEVVSFDFLSVSGTISNGSGPLEGASVELLTSGGASLSPARKVTTDAEGEYTITPVNAGTYSVKVSYDGYNSITINNVILTDSDITGINATIAEPTVVSGTVTAGGNPVAGHSVTMKKGNTVITSTQAGNGNGLYRQCKRVSSGCFYSGYLYAGITSIRRGSSKRKFCKRMDDRK
jgi:hypothetical protein